MVPTSSDNANACDFLILYNEMYHYFQGLHNSVNHCIIQMSNVWVKEPFQVQNRSMDFNITEYEEFIDRVSNSTLQLTFKKLLGFDEDQRT